jgi:hypothetical protein
LLGLRQGWPLLLLGFLGWREECSELGGLAEKEGQRWNTNS